MSLSQSTASLLGRYGQPCTVVETASVRNSVTGAVALENTYHEGVAYKSHDKKAIAALNPSAGTLLVMFVSDGHKVTTKDTVTLEGVNQQVLSVQYVEAAEGLLYQLVEV